MRGLRIPFGWLSRLAQPVMAPRTLRHGPGLSDPPAPADRCATVVIPALNEARQISAVVAYALADPATAEVIVVDDGSIDETAELASRAGATVLTSSLLGKGASMQDAIAPARSDLLVYLDGDLAGLRDGVITDLCRPLLSGAADFVKARFGRAGGRVTELTAKPMLRVFFPELAHVSQPLGGIVASRKNLLRTLSFEDGYGVDVGLMLDAHLAGARIAEVDIGSLEHNSKPLPDLVLMANEVGRVILTRAKAAGRLHVAQVSAMYEMQRHAAAGIDYVLTRRGGRNKLLLLDMDGTVTTSRFAVELARATGHESALMVMLDASTGDVAGRSENIARLFRYVHRTHFERVARSLEIRPGVQCFVNQMRRRGFLVGVISDSYFIAAEIVRRRIFADFALAHTMVFENEVCTGNIRLNPAFLAEPGQSRHPICKSNVLRRFLDDKTPPAINQSWVVGDNINDLELMRTADRAFVIDAKSPAFAREPTITSIDSFGELMELLPAVS